jgi:hypothetical protein
MRWFEAERQRWIAEMLQVYQFINRDHLRRKFGISTAQASKDLLLFQRSKMPSIQYDKSQRCYVVPEPVMAVERARMPQERRSPVE